MTIVNLATGEKREYPRIRRFAFSGDASTWIALQRQAPAAEGRGGAAATPTPVPGLPDRPRGTDLILRELASGQELNVGNVADFAFSKDGSLLAWTIDAQDKVGNGLQLRDMSRGTVAVLDSGNASYERPAWTEKGDGLSVLKGSDDRALARQALRRPRLHRLRPRRAAEELRSIRRATGLSGRHDRQPESHAAVDRGPAGAALRHPDAGPRDTVDGWRPEADDKRRRATATMPRRPAAAPADESRRKGRPRPVALAGQAPAVAAASAGDARPQLQLPRGVPRAPKKFVRLADEDLPTVDLAPKQKFAIGRDDDEYELMANLDGRRFQDIYVVDLATGKRTLAVKSARWYNGPSPDGKSFLYYEDGHYHVYEMETGQTSNITAAAPMSFVDVEDDHNVVKPPADDGLGEGQRFGAPQRRLGHLAGAGRRRRGGQPDGQRPEGADPLPRRYPIEPRRASAGHRSGEAASTSPLRRVDEEGWPRVVDAGQARRQMLNWSDAAFATLTKAQKADVYVYSRRRRPSPRLLRRRCESGERTAAHGSASAGAELRVVRGRQAHQLHERQGRQAAGRALPAGELRAGQEVPDAREHLREAVAGREPVRQADGERPNRAYYTSHGYAVLLPDIVYKVNDPGMSAVWCVVPAVKAAIATGIVDPKKRRPLGPLVGRLPDGVPGHADQHLRGGRRRRAAHRHGQHVQLDLLEHRRRQRRDLRGEPGALQGQLRGTTTTPTSATHRSSTRRT